MTNKTKVPTQEVQSFISRTLALCFALHVAKEADQLKIADDLKFEWFASEICARMKDTHMDESVHKMVKGFQSLGNNQSVEGHRKDIIDVLIYNAHSFTEFLERVNEDKQTSA